MAALYHTNIEFLAATYYLGNELVVPKKGTWILHKYIPLHPSLSPLLSPLFSSSHLSPTPPHLVLIYSCRIKIELFNILLQFSHKSTASSFHIPDRNLIYVGNNYLLWKNK